jgi:hypothetical protein
MASDYRITGNGTTVYLVNSSGNPTSAGAATAAATTPWGIRFADWTPTAAAPNTLFAGGFPVAQSYDVVEETIPLILVGGSHDTMVARLQQLRQVAATWQFSTPAILTAQPSGATSPVYFEIYRAHIQERAPSSSKTPAEGASTCWVDLTITRSAFGGLLSAGETLINAVSLKNTGTGSPNNFNLYGPASGDLIYAGSPLNVSFTGTAGVSAGRIWLASVLERKYSTTGAGTYATSSTTGVSATALSFTMTNNPFDNQGVKGRFMLRFSAFASNAQIQVRVSTLNTGTSLIYTSPWVSAPNTTGVLLDTGGFTLDAMRRSNIAGTTMIVDIWQRSTNGSSASITLTYTEALHYYTFCRVEQGNVALTGSPDVVRAIGFTERSGYPCLPEFPIAQLHNSGTTIADTLTLSGSAPRFYNGAGLYVAWLSNIYVHTTTEAATFTVSHAPLYRTLRGAG